MHWQQTSFMCSGLFSRLGCRCNLQKQAECHDKSAVMDNCQLSTQGNFLLDALMPYIQRTGPAAARMIHRRVVINFSANSDRHFEFFSLPFSQPCQSAILDDWLQLYESSLGHIDTFILSLSLSCNDDVVTGQGK